MADRSPVTADFASTSPSEEELLARVAACTACRKVTDCFGRLVCLTRDRA